MMFHKSIPYILISFLFCSNAFASIFIEPFVGYAFGSNITLNNYSYAGQGITDNGAYSGGTGIGFGASGGYQYLGFFLGANYLHRNFNFSNESFSSSKDSSIDEIGFIAGYRFPLLLKVYIGKNLIATGTLEHRSGKLEMKDGGGSFFGMGFTGIPFMNINFEYHKGYFGEQRNASLISGKQTNYDYLFLSLSLPLIF